MNNKKAIHIFKHIVYALLLLILYILQTTPRLFMIREVKPMWVIPAAIVIAMYEGEFVGGVYGAAAGILCDAGAVPRQSGGSVLFGFNGFLLCAFCVACGLLIIYLLRCNLLGCMLFVTVTMLARGSLEYLFAYGMWRHDGGWMIYLYYTLPTTIYTLVVTPLIFRLAGGIHRRFEAVLHP